MNELQIAGQTDVGRRRNDNQDTFISEPIWSGTSALLAAIDGVGGYVGGDRAAAIARESIGRYMATPKGDPLSMLREAVVFANNQINDQRQQDRRLAQMCCVLTTAVADADAGRLYFVHVGDTRLYRFRQGELEKLTHDHSFVGIREDARELTEAEAMQHPRRNEILRELGSAAHRVDDPDFLESGETNFRPGDVLLLCSDGLTDMITQAQIRQVLGQSLSLEEQIATLIRLANQAGGNDNITVVLARNGASSGAQPLTTTGLDKARTQELPPVRVQPVERPEPAVKIKPAGRSLAGLWFFMGLLLGGAIAALVWYQYQPSGHAGTPSDSLQTTTGPFPASTPIAPTNARLDSLLKKAYRSPDHRLALLDDTLRLTQPLVLTDSLLTIIGNRLTVIVPADSARVGVALRVDRRGPVALEDVQIRGFKTGIETTGAGTLRLTRVYFQDVEQPVRATVRQDTCRNTVITVSVQNQPVSTQSPRP